MKIVYVAGKYRAKTSNEIWHNINTARLAGEQIVKQGDMPLIPHMNGAFMDGLQTDEFWLDGTLELMKRCDAIYLLDNWQDSEGARNEWRVAQELNIPLYEIRSTKA